MLRSLITFSTLQLANKQTILKRLASKVLATGLNGKTGMDSKNEINELNGCCETSQLRRSIRRQPNILYPKPQKQTKCQAQQRGQETKLAETVILNKVNMVNWDYAKLLSPNEEVLLHTCSERIVCSVHNALQQFAGEERDVPALKM